MTPRFKAMPSPLGSDCKGNHACKATSEAVPAARRCSPATSSIDLKHSGRLPPSLISHALETDISALQDSPK